MGSRFATYSLLLTYSFLIYLLDIKFLNKIKYFSILLIIPFFLFYLSGNILKNIQIDIKIKSLKLENKDYESKEHDELIKLLDQKNSKVNKSRYIEKINNTSGRVQIWENALEVAKERDNHFFGNGINADRRLLVKYGNEFGTNASNGFINTYLTSGILGLCLFILANLIIVIKIYIFIFTKKCFFDFSKYYLINLSILIIFVFYQRIFFENSFTSFGLDYLIYIVCCYFILNNIKNIKSYKT